MCLDYNDLLVVTIFWSFAHPMAPVATTASIIFAPIKSRMEAFWYQISGVVR